ARERRKRGGGDQSSCVFLSRCDCTASMCRCDTAMLTVCVRSATHSRGGRFRLESVTTIQEPAPGRDVRGYLPLPRPWTVRKSPFTTQACTRPAIRRDDHDDEHGPNPAAHPQLT